MPLFDRTSGAAAQDEGEPARDGERGAVAVLVALFMLVFITLLAFVVDVGTVYVTRSQLQTAADAAAIAAVADLPPAGVNCAVTPNATACATARTFAASNGVPNALMSVVSPYGGDSQSVEVTTSQQVRFVFGPVIGQNGRIVTARAVATKELVDSTGYGIFSAGLWRVNGGGTGLSVSGGGGYAGSTDFNGNANNKHFLSPVGLQSPENPKPTTRWTDSTGTERSSTITVASQGTALQYATSIGLDGAGGVIPAMGTPPAANWAKAEPSGNCTINQAKLTALAAYQVIYCDGTATVSGVPSASTEMIRAASITIGTDIGWNGSSCAATVILYATGAAGVQNSGTDNDVCGTIYAPNGEFGTNGGGVDLHQGRVIAASVLLSGNGGAFVSTAGDPFLQTAVPRLVE